jgi:hypothetical protein
MSGRFSFIAIAALSRKKALIVEPISHTWRNKSSYSSGRNFTVTRTVQADLRWLVIRYCFFRYLREEVRFSIRRHRAPSARVVERSCSLIRPPVGSTMSHLSVENEDQSCRWLFLMEAFL